MDNDHRRFSSLVLLILAVAFTLFAVLKHLDHERQDERRADADALADVARQEAILDVLDLITDDCYTPFFFHLGVEERDRVSYPTIRPERAVWRTRPDGAWECVANLRGTITATSAAVCAELRAKLACPNQRDLPATTP